METCILLAIRPEFAKKILYGEKKYEFRRTLFKRDFVKKVIIYASSPIKKIIGEFDIDYVLTLEKDLLWSITCSYAGIRKDIFDEYFSGKSIGNAIKVKNPKEYSTPLELSYYNVRRAPQSFVYLNKAQQKIN